MSQLADRLHAEHETMLDLLKRLRTAGPENAEGHQMLIDARDLILHHLKQEDDHLYPVLRANQFTSDIAETFSSEMSPLAQRFIDFFDKYDLPEDSTAFKSELGRLLAALQKRIAREEYVLLPTYKQIRLSAEENQQHELAL